MNKIVPQVGYLKELKKNESLEITNKMQPCNRIYYSNVYWMLNMFRAAYRSSSGALNCICSLWFIYTCGDLPVTTCVYKRWNNKFYYKVASCWLFLVIYITMHGSRNIEKKKLTHCGRVTQICVFNTVKLGISASSP